jgi:hypothetical protein
MKIKDAQNEDKNTEMAIKPQITGFYFDEIMNGIKDLSFHRGEYKVIDLFGKPLKINIEKVSFSFEGGLVTEIHKYVYKDFVHYYYIFESGTIFYSGFVIENKLERLKTINIGDTADKLLSAFSDEYYTFDENIIFYTDPVICEIQFIINDKIIQRIYVNYLLI